MLEEEAHALISSTERMMVENGHMSSPLVHDDGEVDMKPWVLVLHISLGYQVLARHPLHLRPAPLFHFLVKLVSKVPVLVKIHRPGKDVHNSKIRGAQPRLHSECLVI